MANKREFAPDLDLGDPDAIVEYSWGVPDIEEASDDDAI